MSNEIKRWDYDHLAGGASEDAQGSYVLYSDHEAEIARAYDDAHCKIEAIYSEEIAHLRAEVEGLRVKASRYDWIRRNAVLDVANGDQLDSEIDAAMGASA
jgi:hypothetical protein